MDDKMIKKVANCSASSQLEFLKPNMFSWYQLV